MSCHLGRLYGACTRKIPSLGGMRDAYPKLHHQFPERPRTNDSAGRDAIRYVHSPSAIRPPNHTAEVPCTVCKYFVRRIAPGFENNKGHIDEDVPLLRGRSYKSRYSVQYYPRFSHTRRWVCGPPPR